MNSDFIFNVLKSIHSEDYSPLRSASNLKEKISTYINCNDFIKNSVEVSLDKEDFTLNFKPFNIKLRCDESIKFYELPPVNASCVEMDFVLHDKTEKTSVIKIYLTNDGYILKDVYEIIDICKIDNEYRGKKVFDEILSSLINKGLIVVPRNAIP